MAYNNGQGSGLLVKGEGDPSNRIRKAGDGWIWNTVCPRIQKEDPLQGILEEAKERENGEMEDGLCLCVYLQTHRPVYRVSGPSENSPAQWPRTDVKICIFPLSLD